LPEFDKRPVKKPVSQRSPAGQVRSDGNIRILRRKENIAVSIFRGLLPWKGDAPGDIVRKLIFIGSLALIIWAAGHIIDFYVLREARSAREWREIMEIRDSYTGEEFIGVHFPQHMGSDGTGGEPVNVIGMYYDWYNKNNDFVGYLEIYPIIQHPVYQYAYYDENGAWVGDNEFYLKHNHDRIPTTNGTVFADWEGRFTPTERPHNIIIYGHNLQNKDLFQPLMNYRPNRTSGVDSFEFLKQNPVITFDTLYEYGTYKIFAVFQSNIRPTQGEVFDYWRHVYFRSKSHFDNFVAGILDRSMYYTNVDLQYGDELLMLSTCDFEIFANGADSSVRLVIVARRVRDNEYAAFTQAEIDAFIDNRGVNENGQLRRRMFEEYYRVRFPSGWGGRNWDLNYIKDFER
jgi:sortase B